jgi:hypothetical protein
MLNDARFDFECLTLQTGKVTLELVISQMRQNPKGRRGRHTIQGRGMIIAP